MLGKVVRKFGVSEHELAAELAGWGILDLPLIKDFKDIVGKGLHKMGDFLQPKKVLNPRYHLL